MTPRPDFVARAAPSLPPGSEIRHAFIGPSAPNFASFLITYATGLTMSWIKHRCVAVTHDAVYVVNSTKLSGGGRPVSLVGTLPRHTRLGPVSGRRAELALLDERHWVHQRFHCEIAAADSEERFTDPQP